MPDVKIPVEEHLVYWVRLVERLIAENSKSAERFPFNGRTLVTNDFVMQVNEEVTCELAKLSRFSSTSGQPSQLPIEFVMVCVAKVLLAWATNLASVRSLDPTLDVENRRAARDVAEEWLGASENLALLLEDLQQVWPNQKFEMLEVDIEDT